MSTPTKPQLPVVLLAFAADRQGTFLRSIAEEQDVLTRTLRAAEDAGQCKVVTLANADAAKIVQIFQDYRGAVRLFHYGGHADGYGLLLSSAPGAETSVDGKSFANFLAAQQGLELVFLNGCSSQGQADDLVAAGARTVIATSEAINDAAAKQFAETLYRSLVTGATVATAFEEASSAVLMGAGGKTRSLYWDIPEAPKSQMPWHVFGDDESDWKLTDAAQDVQLLNTVAAVRALHVKARTKEALQQLVAFLTERNHPMLNDVSGLQARFTANERANLMGTISYDEGNRTRNQISAALLALLGELEGR